MSVKKEYRLGAHGHQSVETGMPAWEPVCRLRASLPSVTYCWAAPAKMRKKCCYGQEKNLGQYSSPSLSPLISHTQQKITLSKIKCERFHHHHHIALVARISLTLSRHSSLSFIVLGRSSGQHPVYSHSCSFVIEVVHCRLMMFPHISVYLYMYMCGFINGYIT